MSKHTNSILLSSGVDVSIRPIRDDDFGQVVIMNRIEYGVSEVADYVDSFSKLQWWGSIEIFKLHYEILSQSGGGVIVATYLDNVVGELDYNLEDGVAHIFWLLVHKDYRRKGIAKMLIKNLQQVVGKDVVITVIAEDERSDRLYKSMGNVKAHLRNFSYIYENSVQNPPVIDMDVKLMSIFDNFHHERVIGQYHLPRYDLKMLQKTVNSIVHDSIWGANMNPVVFKFVEDGCEYIVIMTQYIRIYASCRKHIAKVLEYTTKMLDQMGFESANIQIYDDLELVDILTQLNFHEDEVTMDPIYQISPP